jgi:hypothetical protein
MPTKLRWHAEITGHVVQFFRRNPQKPNSRLAPRWKAEYHTIKDAKEAKRVSELVKKLAPKVLRVLTTRALVEQFLSELSVALQASA